MPFTQKNKSIEYFLDGKFNLIPQGVYNRPLITIKHIYIKNVYVF